MEQYIVTGMSCAACSSRVEKAVSKVEGVTSCSVSLLTNSMGVEGTASPEAIIQAVEAAGYGASKKGAPGAGAKTGGSGSAGAAGNAEELLKDRETPVLKQRLIWSLGFLVVLMYFSMGHMMWNWPVPAWMEGNHIAMGLLQMILAAIVMVINQKFFISGFKSLWHKAPNMDTLVALGSMASFGYSTYALFAMTDVQLKGSTELVMEYMHDFYFESAAMILALITVGKMLEALSQGKLYRLFCTQSNHDPVSLPNILLQPTKQFMAVLDRGIWGADRGLPGRAVPARTILCHNLQFIPGIPVLFYLLPALHCHSGIIHHCIWVNHNLSTSCGGARLPYRLKTAHRCSPLCSRLSEPM